MCAQVLVHVFCAVGEANGDVVGGRVRVRCDGRVAAIAARRRGARRVEVRVGVSVSVASESGATGAPVAMGN